jgi:hypothetical protein
MKKSTMVCSGLLALVTSFINAQEREELARIGRCVDNRAIRQWADRLAGIDPNREHDGKSWRQREREFNFRIIGLRPTDLPCVYNHISTFPVGLEKHSPIELFFALTICSSVMSADELHYGISKVAEKLSSKEVMGPLACRTTVVLMKNVGGAGGIPGREMEITKDQYPYPVELHLHFQYFDPDAAAAYIKKREEEAK